MGWTKQLYDDSVGTPYIFMQYLFLLGREPLLSEAEIVSILSQGDISFDTITHPASRGHFLIIETDRSLDPLRLMSRLRPTPAISGSSTLYPERHPMKKS